MKIKKLQTGGMVAPQEQQANPSNAGTEEKIISIATQLIQEMGPEAATMLANAIMQLVQQAQTPPTYQRQGGKLVLKGKRA